MKIQRILIIFFIIICGFSIATITMAVNLKNTLNQVEKAQTNRHESLKLADELRQSSDDLTRFARTYVTTGEKKYKKYFQQVLDIRNGILSRPDDYQNIYWDLVITNKLDPPSTDGVNKQSLETKMINAGFTMNEFNELRKAQGRSDKLVSLEALAMNAIEGKFDDGSGDFNIIKQPDREMAIKLMHGRQYHIEKSSIMEPIKAFIHLVDKRTEKKLTELNKIAQKLVVLITISGICLIVAFVLMIWILNNRILNKANKLLHTSIKILDGDLNARSNIKGSDELGSVGKTFDTMIEKLSNTIIDAEEKTKNESERYKQLQIEQTRSESEIHKKNKTLTKSQLILNEKDKQIKQLADQLVYTQENERQNVSQFIHNDLGQYLTALNLEISHLEKEIPSTIPMKSIKDLIETALKKVKAIAKFVHPPQLNNQPLKNIFESHAQDILPDEITAVFNIDLGNESDLTDIQKLTLFRAYQEGLTNIIRHANATKVHISLTNSSNNYCLKINDNGKGFNNNTYSTGLNSVKHRITLLDGDFKIIKNKHSSGTIFQVSIPLNSSYL